MAIARKIDSILYGYNESCLSLGFIGSHSALDGCSGARDEGIRNFVIAKIGRDRTYTEAFCERDQGDRTVGVVQDVYRVENWKDMTRSDVISWMRERNGVFVPSRSLAVYLRDKST